ncbi:MAG: hypothetical protein J6D52_00815, partial [Clostridia bacterium]|nr:hypothetical protein [Clostridia bacterium]
YDTCLHYYKISQLLFVTIAYPPIILLYNILPHPPTFYYPKKSKKKRKSRSKRQNPKKNILSALNAVKAMMTNFLTAPDVRFLT